MKTARKYKTLRQFRGSQKRRKPKPLPPGPEPMTSVRRGKVVQLVQVTDPITGERWAEVFDAAADRAEEFDALSSLALCAKAGHPSEE